MKRFLCLVILIATTLACRYESSLLFRPTYKVYIPMVQKINRPGLGYQVEGYLRGRERFLIEGATVLLQLHWSDVEKSRGVYDWPAEFDQDVLRVSGQRLLISIKGTPAWARDGGLECDAPKPEYYSAFGAFVRLTAERYHPLGVEIWNEPDAKHCDPAMARFYGCIGDGQVYANLVRAVHEALQGMGVETISGALLGSREFWGQAVGEGINEYSDAISFHAYPVWPNPNVYLAFDQAAWIKRYSPGLPLYLTETSLLCDMGCDSRFLLAQADYQHALYSQAVEHGIELVLWYSLANNNWRNSDLVIHDIRKPAWFAMERILR